MTSNSLSWICCPKCGECEGLKRLQPIKETRNGKIVVGNKIECEFCGTLFVSEKATRKEAFGFDYGAGKLSV
jgi:hypothetical protein